MREMCHLVKFRGVNVTCRKIPRWDNVRVCGRSQLKYIHIWHVARFHFEYAGEIKDLKYPLSTIILHNFTIMQKFCTDC